MLRSSSTTLNTEMSSDSVPNVFTVSTLQISYGQHTETEIKVKVYKRRIWMALLYFILDTLNAMLMPQFVSMADVNGCYYGVSQSALDWTTQMFLLVYIVLMIPASLISNYLDLRRSLICGSALNTIACLLQFLTLQTSGFSWVMVSCFFGSLSCLFTMGQPSNLAARWFPSNELSRACAVSALSSGFGTAIGLVFSPFMVSSDCTSTHAVAEGKRNVAYLLSIVNAVVLILIIFTFQNAPELPPNVVRLERTAGRNAKDTVNAILRMVKNIDYILVFVLTGLMVGCYYAFITAANDLMIRYFPGKEVEVALITTLSTLMGLLGSVIAGCVLDYTHRFKETTITYCIMGLLSYILFGYLLHFKLLWVQYLIAGTFGFFVSGFLPIGVEYGIETTFPVPEMLSCNMLCWSMHMFGIILIQIVSHLLDSYGPLYLHISMGITLLSCTVIASFLTKIYKRSKRNLETEEI